MAADVIFQHLLDLLGPALRVSLDPLAIVDDTGRLLYCNGPMRAFLELKGKAAVKTARFQEKLQIHDSGGLHPVDRALVTGEEIRLDEEPATKASGQKVRILFKAVPLFDPTQPEARKVFAAIVSLRDTSGEVLLQAKYHKLLEMQDDKELEILDLKEKLSGLMESMKRHRPR